MKKDKEEIEELDIEKEIDDSVTDENQEETSEYDETEKETEVDEDFNEEYEEETEYDEDEEYDEDDEEPKKKSKVGLIIGLIFGWAALVGLIVVFYVFFLEDLPIMNKDKTTTTEEIEITYEVNANEAINALIQEYFFALEECNQEKLMSLVIDFSAFSDMSKYERVASVMGNYQNFTVYTLPGYYGSDVLVYVTCNFDIGGVNTKGLNINQFYIVNTTEGYKIDNTAPDEAVANYISEQNGKPDIQALYKDVYAYIEESAANDPAFKKFAEDYGILQ